MSIRMELSSVFGRFTGNQLNFEVKGSTIGECVRYLVKKFPELDNMLLDKQGKLRPSFDVYLNDKSTYPEKLARPVKDGDKINLMMLILGG